MQCRTCRLCQIEKPFIRGSWVWSKAYGPTGTICLACHLDKQRSHNQAYCAKRNAEDAAWRNRRAELAKKASKSKYASSAEYRLKELTRGLLYAKNNPDKHNARYAKRRARKQQASPNWLTADDHLQIAAMYSLAKIMEACTGIAYHVDHIIPLQGALVSGLHVPYNLQVIEAAKNLSKGNKHV